MLYMLYVDICYICYMLIYVSAKYVKYDYFVLTRAVGVKVAQLLKTFFMYCKGRVDL